MGDRIMKARLFRPMRSSASGGQQGFTLIEVLISMAVFAIGIMAVTAMAIRGFDGFATSRATTAEVHRNVRVMDTFKSAFYYNTQIFDTTPMQPANYPFGNDAADFISWDFNNVVVRDVKFIAIENQQLRSPTPSGFYRLFFTKAGKPQVN
jgi:prepilin-type N-terminal cleavage/methylation domain-containing protein